MSNIDATPPHQSKSAVERMVFLEGYRALLNQAKDSISLLSIPELQFIDTNSSSAHLFHKDRKQLLSFSLFELLDQKSRQAVTTWLAAQKSSDQDNLLFESKLAIESDQEIVAEFSLSRVEFEGENFIVCVGQDVTEKVQTEAALKQSEAMLSIVMDTIPSPIFYKDSQGVYTGCNGAFENYLGIGRDTIIGSTVYDIAPKELADVYHKADLDLMAENGTQTYEAQVKYADGSLHDVVFFKACFNNTRGEVEGLVGVILDITERKAAERDLKQLRNLLTSVLDSIPSSVIGINESGMINLWNDQAENEWSIPATEAIGKPVEELCPELQINQQKIDAAIAGGAETHDERIEIRRPNGHLHYLDVTLSPLNDETQAGAVLRVDNVTNKVRVEEMMSQTSKMLSVGGLAVGMAHEINNPLAGILQNIQILEQRCAGKSKLSKKVMNELNIAESDLHRYTNEMGFEKILSNIRNSGQRAADIVKKMLTLSRFNRSPYVTHDLGKIVSEAIALAKNQFDAGFSRLQINTSTDPGPLVAACDPEQLQQVILSILKNGYEAIKEQKGSETVGTIDIRLHSDNGTTRIEISDNGVGMDNETRQRVFEPFFTTKRVGEGIGLGLSSCYFIVTQSHHGSIYVESEPGVGSTFRIELPKAKARPTAI